MDTVIYQKIQIKILGNALFFPQPQENIHDDLQETSSVVVVIGFLSP